MNIIDGTNLERNLYLTTQLLELGIPVILAVNMMDVVRKNGDVIDLKKLSEKLGCQAVAISALKGEGIMDAAKRAVSVAVKKTEPPRYRFSDQIEFYLDEIERMLGSEILPLQRRFFAVKLFERDDKIQSQMKEIPDVEPIIREAEHMLDDDAESMITNARYEYRCV